MAINIKLKKWVHIILTLVKELVIKKLRIIFFISITCAIAAYYMTNVMTKIEAEEQYKVLIGLITIFGLLSSLSFSASRSSLDSQKKEFFKIAIMFFQSVSFLLGCLVITFVTPILQDFIIWFKISNFIGPDAPQVVYWTLHGINILIFMLGLGMGWYSFNRLSIILAECL